MHRNNKPVNTLLKIRRTQYRDSPAILGLATDLSAIKSFEQAQLESAGKLVRALNSIIEAMASTMQLRDPYTYSHQQRVTEIACAIAKEMQLSESKVEGIRLGAIVHDLGKIYIPSEILSKPPPLNSVELNLIRMHPRAGYDILKRIDFPWPIPEIALNHHERVDGSGYPGGKFGKDVLIEAHIVAVADVVEAISSHRPYRPAMGVDNALVEIKKHSGKLFNSDVVDACLKLFYEKGFKY